MFSSPQSRTYSRIVLGGVAVGVCAAGIVPATRIRAASALDRIGGLLRGDEGTAPSGGTQVRGLFGRGFVPAQRDGAAGGFPRPVELHSSADPRLRLGHRPRDVIGD